MLKMNLSNIRTSQITAATEVSQEAMVAAQLVIERNKDNLGNLMILGEINDAAKMSTTGAQMALAERIKSDFNEAMEMMPQGVTRQELFDAIEKQSARTNAKFGVDQLTRVMQGTEELLEFAEEMIAARTNRIASFYGSIKENELANKAQESLSRAEARKEFYDKYFNLIDEKEIKNQVRKRALEGQDEQVQAVLKMIFEKEDALEGLSDDQADNVRRARAIYGANEMQEKVAQKTQDNLRSAGQAVTEDRAESKFKKILRNMLAGEDYAEAADKTKYKKISKFMKEDLANLFSENKIFRNSIYGMGALIAGSLLYSAVQDRSPENVGGPSLLPGGSAYEQYPQRAPQMPRIPDQSYNPGVSYKVNLYGGRSDIEEFTRVFSGFGENMDVDTTMYSGMPEVGRDPYQEIASSY
jgi:hypothetical protein